MFPNIYSPVLLDTHCLTKYSATGVCVEGSVRLQGGDSAVEGNVEVCVDGLWNQVCDSHWDSHDATVVCRQLNHSVIGLLSKLYHMFV